MFSTKKFLISLLIIMIGGIIYTGYSLISIYKLKSSDEYLSQIQDINNKISSEKRNIAKIKRIYKKNLNISTLEYYMSLVKQLKYIVTGSTEISNFSLKFVKNKKLYFTSHKNLKKNKLNQNVNLLTKYLTPYKGNKFINQLSLITIFQLSKNKNIDVDNSLLNFFKLYKPLIYLYYLKENKPIIIRNIKFSNNTYNIYMQILGK